MKKTLRAFSLLLALLLLPGMSAFADAPGTDCDDAVIGSWSIYAIVIGVNSMIPETGMPLYVAENHTGFFELGTDSRYTFTWQYSETGAGAYIFTAVVTDPDGNTAEGLMTYIYDYEGMNGQLCFILGEDTGLFCVRA